VDDSIGARMDPDYTDRRRVYQVIAAQDGLLSGRQVAVAAGYPPTSRRAEELVAQLVQLRFIRRQRAGSSILHFVASPWREAPEGQAGTE
jgi:hypothetical protein